MSAPDEGAGSGTSARDAPWYQGAVGWLPLSRAFIDRELGKPEPDYRSLADRLADYGPAERHAGWIGIAQSAPSRMARTRAYVEALYNDADPTSVAWSWLDGDFDLMERVEHVLSPDADHTPATVEELRDRIGSIVDVGGDEMPVPIPGATTDAGSAGGPDGVQLAAAETAAMSEAEVAAEGASRADAAEPDAAEPVAAEPESGPDAVPTAATGVSAADEAWAQLTADAAETEVAQPAAGQSPAVRPAAATPQAAQAATPAYWSPTHFVPAAGMAAWDHPDPARPPRVVLNAGLGLVIDGIAGDWALVRAVNGWRGWVDGRRLTTRP